MRRKVQFLYAGHGGKPVYVHGFLTDEHGDGGAAGRLLLEVTGSEPEPRPKPGVYGADDLPGGWLRLIPDAEQSSPEQDAGIVQAARASGFTVRERP